MNQIALTQEQLKEVTGFVQPSKQCQALALMDIPFKVRPDGTPFVALAAIEGTDTVKQTEPVLTLI